MKYRRLPVEWHGDSFRSYGFCRVSGRRHVITCTGRSWFLCEIVGDGSADNPMRGVEIGQGEVGPSRSPRLAAVKALRRHLGLIDCREGWSRSGNGYNFGDAKVGARIFEGPGGILHLQTWRGLDYKSGVHGDSFESLAEAAEQTLGVTPCP